MFDASRLHGGVLGGQHQLAPHEDVPRKEPQDSAAETRPVEEVVVVVVAVVNVAQEEVVVVVVPKPGPPGFWVLGMTTSRE